MSTHPITPAPGILGFDGFLVAVTSAIRAPVTVAWDDATKTATYLFTPDLTAGEAQTFADLVATFRTHDVAITPAEYQAIKPSLATLRTQRQRTDAQWNALTAAQRDTQLIAWSRAITDVLRALLRD